MNTQIFILYCLLTIIRYAKENYRKRIKCTISSASNTGREESKESIESRGSKTNSERLGKGLRTCQGNLFQNERCKENTKESRRVKSLPIPSFFSNIKHKLTATYLILDNVIYQPEMLKLIPYIWKSEVIT